MTEKILNAKKREIGTKGDVKQLRRDGFVPGVFYTKGKEQIIFSTEEIALNKLVYTSETSIIQFTLEDGESFGCIIKDVQFDPVSDRIVHIDLQGITLGQVLQLEVPVVFVGSAVGVSEGGILQEQLRKLEIECLPRNIPQNLEIDITNLGIGDSIKISDLEFEDVKLLNSDDSTVVSVVPPMSEEEPVEEETEADADVEAAEPEVISKGKADEDE